MEFTESSCLSLNDMGQSRLGNSMDDQCDFFFTGEPNTNHKSLIDDLQWRGDAISEYIAGI